MSTLNIRFANLMKNKSSMIIHHPTDSMTIPLTLNLQMTTMLKDVEA
jgi:hypothetical protein